MVLRLPQLSPSISCIKLFNPTLRWKSRCSSFEAPFRYRMVRSWRRRVRNHASNVLDLGPDEAAHQEVQRRYGTTILAGLMTQEYVLLAQLGDGCIVRYHQKQAIHPFREDPRLLGKESHSLTSPDAVDLMQIAVAGRSTDELLLLASDGLTDSFSNEEGVHRLLVQMSKPATSSEREQMAGGMSSWMDRCSANGSGDDITLVVAGGRTQPSSTTDATEQRSFLDRGIQRVIDLLAEMLARRRGT